MKYGTQPSTKHLHEHHHGSGIKKNLTQGNIFLQLLLFALPILLTNILQQAYNLTDSIIVGRFVGKEALAGVGANNSISNLLLCLFMGLGAGGGVVVAQYYGAKDEQNVSKAVHTIIAICLICGAVMSVVGYFLARPILLLINSPADVIEHSTAYLQIYFLGVMAVLFYNMGSSILRAIGDSITPLIILFACASVNVGLDLLFVVKYNMGISGAAWATVISQAVSAILVLFRLIFSRSVVRLSFSKLRIDKQMLLRTIKIGIPIGLQSSMFSFANLILQANLSPFGSTVMAGWVAANKVDNLAYAPIQSFGIAVNTFTGQNCGAKRYDRVRKGVFVAGIMSFVTALLVVVPMMVFRNSIITVFTKQADVIEIGARAMMFILPFYSVFGLTEVLSGTLRGAGRSSVSATIASFGILGTRIFWLYVIVRIWPTVDVLFFVHPISWVVNFLLFLTYYLVKKWQGVLGISKEQMERAKLPYAVADSQSEPCADKNQQPNDDEGLNIRKDDTDKPLN